MVEASYPPAGTEALDRRDMDATVAAATLREIAWTNRWLGGDAAVAFGMRALLHDIDHASLTVLDVGAGDGGIGRRIRGTAFGARLRWVALDHHRTATAMAQSAGVLPVLGDMWAMPFAAGSADIVLANLVLHHVDRTDAIELIRRFDTIARCGVVIADLRRSAIAAGAFGVAGSLLRFHPATRHDGVVSIRRGFTSAELRRLLRAAGVEAPVVYRRPGWRMIAMWRKHAHR